MKTLVIVFPLFLFTFHSFAERRITNNMPSTQTDTVYYIPGKIKHAARLFSDMENQSSVVLYIPADSTVQILSPVNKYFLVHFDGIEGYIYQKKVENFPEILKEFNQPVSDKEDVQNQVDNKKYQVLVSKYGEDIGTKISEHKIWRGMSPTMVQDSWGTPQVINRSADKEEWFYQQYILVFYDGKLISMYSRNKKHK